MVMSSTDVSNVIQGQMGMFASSASYVQAATSNNYQGVQAGGATQDTRSAGNVQAAGVANAASRVPGMAMGGMAMAASFGMAPRILDPFSSGANAYGAVRKVGGGMGAALSAGAASAGAVVGMGVVMNHMTAQPFMQGAQARAGLNAQMASVMPNANANQLGQMSQSIESMNRLGVGSMNELSSLVSSGVSSGDISTRSIADFTSSFQKLVSTATSIATTLKTSITEGNAALQTVRGMGVSMEQAPGFVGSMAAMGRASGQSPGEMLGHAGAGIGLARAVGIDATSAAMGSMTNQSVARMAMNQNLIEGQYEGQYDKLQMGGMRFLGSRQGSQVLSAAFDPETGRLNQDLAAQIASGGMDAKEIRSRSAKTMSASGGAFRSARGELAGEYMSEFGAGGIANPLSEMTGGNQGMMQRLTQLHRADLSVTNQMSAIGPRLRMQIMEEARSGFQEGQQQNMGLGQAIGAAVKQIAAPYRAKFRALGASMTQTVMSAMEDSTSMLTAGGRPMQDNYLSDRMQIGANAGDSSSVNYMNSIVAGGGTGGSRTLGYTAGSHLSDEKRETMEKYVPPIARMGTFTGGTNPLSLPGGGFNLSRYNENYTTASTVMGVAGLGRMVARRQALALPGMALGGVGNAITKAVGGGMRAGLRGVGTFRGVAAMGGGLAKMGGGILRGGGRFAGAPLVAAAAVTANYMFNYSPEQRRRAGQEQHTSGAMSGHNAKLFSDMGDIGAIDLEPITGGKVKEGFSPIFNPSLEADKQMQISAANIEKGVKFMDTPPSVDEISKYGTRDGLRKEIHQIKRKGGSIKAISQDLARNHDGMDPKLAYRLANHLGGVSGIQSLHQDDVNPGALVGKFREDIAKEEDPDGTADTAGMSHKLASRLMMGDNVGLAAVTARAFVEHPSNQNLRQDAIGDYIDGQGKGTKFYNRQTSTKLSRTLSTNTSAEDEDTEKKFAYRMKQLGNKVLTDGYTEGIDRLGRSLRRDEGKTLDMLVGVGTDSGVNMGGMRDLLTGMDGEKFVGENMGKDGDKHSLGTAMLRELRASGADTAKEYGKVSRGAMGIGGAAGNKLAEIAHYEQRNLKYGKQFKKGNNSEKWLEAYVGAQFQPSGSGTFSKADRAALRGTGRMTQRLQDTFRNGARLMLKSRGIENPIESVLNSAQEDFASAARLYEQGHHEEAIDKVGQLSTYSAPSSGNGKGRGGQVIDETVLPAITRFTGAMDLLGAYIRKIVE